MPPWLSEWIIRSHISRARAGASSAVAGGLARRDGAAAGVSARAAGEGLLAAALARQRAEIVDYEEIALDGWALGGLQAREPVAQRFHLLLDPLLLDLRLGAAHLEALVLAELGLGQHADLDRELERLALGRQVAHVDVERRIADGDDARGGDRVGVPAR